MHKKVLRFAAILMSAVLMASCAADTDKNGGISDESKNSAVKMPDAEGRTVLTDSKIGTEGDYGYELWKDYGNTTMILTDDGGFACEWHDINNALFRRGFKFDCTKTYKEIGNITVEYDADYSPDGNSYFALYGWTKSPLVEYYIVESWGNWRPPGGEPTAAVNIDGVMYDIYETTRYNMPSIEGTATFQQYWAVRQEKSSEGTINAGKVFATWEALGMEMGKFYEASLTVEGFQSQGIAVINKNIITVGGELPGPAEGLEIEQADENGFFVISDFEDSENGGWKSRGSSKLKVTDEAAFTGKNSLYVSGRNDSWHGAARPLKTVSYTPGKSYGFSVWAMQQEADSAEFKLTLQYTLNGQTNYSNVASATGAKGEWVELSNASFKIPDGASGMQLYVETADGKMSFYIDDGLIAEDGVLPDGEASDGDIVPVE